MKKLNYFKEELDPYYKMNSDLIPLHVWNKMIKGKDRGKTPIDREWNTKKYDSNKLTHNNWVEKSLNIGVRLNDQDLIVDLDPRNYKKDIDSEQIIAELFGYFDFEELTWEESIVQTGSGGWHIYCKLPDGTDYKLIKKYLKEIPGVDFKKKGGYVVAAGSKHPNGNHYQWENIEEPSILPKALLDLILREPIDTDPEYRSGYGVFNGEQLRELILDKLDVTDYCDNDTWEPLMMAAHHATGGDGIDQFVEWCLEDLDYEDNEHQIRARWESLHDNQSGSRRAASLIHELKQKGIDTRDAKAVLEFGNANDFLEIDEEESLEAVMLSEAKAAANEIDINDIIEVPKDKGGVTGAAIDEARKLSKQSSMEDKMKVIRLIKAATIEESIEAQEILISMKIMNQSAINKRLKALESKILDSVTEILANTTINSVFKEGKNIITEPNKQLWAFHKTHWKPLTDEYLGKMVYGVLDTLKSKMDLEVNEVGIVTMAVKGIRMRTSVITSRLFNTQNYKSVVNCLNGEVWIQEDGTHTLKPHSYRSYQLRCLNVDYSLGAECPLFIQTLREIFANYDDTEEIIRHLAEVLGYVIQPYKPDANWWMFRGPGGDGKSTIIKILNGILGDALYSADEGILNVGSSGGNNHAITDLVGKLAVVIQELKVGKALNDSGLKMLAENTKLTANPKNKDPFPFNYIGSLIMCSNFYPIIRDTSEGTIRRANVIPFNREFVKHNSEDSNRSKRILEDKEELAGVLNFMLEGYQRYISRGKFDPPKSCLMAKEEWLSEANNVFRFIKDNIDKNVNADTEVGLASEVYFRYDRWCEINGVKKKGRNTFYLDLENAGIKRHNGGGNRLVLLGGVLLDEELDDFDDLS